MKLKLKDSDMSKGKNLGVKTIAWRLEAGEARSHRKERDGSQELYNAFCLPFNYTERES